MICCCQKLFALGACVALPPLLAEGQAGDLDCSNALHACVVAELPLKVSVVCLGMLRV